MERKDDIDVTNLTRGVGALLIVLGLGAYLGSGAASPTALLPAVLGAVLLGLGLAAGNPSWRAAALHAAMVVALLGALGTLMQVAELPALLRGDDVERPLAVVAGTLTAISCVLLLVLGVRSFVAARRTRSLAQ